MQRKKYFYLIELQYLGFRFHGWQKQPDVLTVEKMVERTLSYILERRRFKVIAAGRTDAKVSVNQTYMELFLEETPLEIDEFFALLNQNLPQDVRALSIQETDAKFNIIQHPKVKEYIYMFSYGEKFHPFCAPFMIHISEDLNIPEMQKAARLFEGEHDFRSYCYKPTPTTQTQGTILQCELKENTLYTASFFPEKSYMLQVKGEGFKRHQIRLMMGALLDVGKGQITLDFIKRTLNPQEDIKLEHIAQASGLMLHKVTLK